MLVKTFGSAVYGVEAITITVEVNVTDCPTDEGFRDDVSAEAVFNRFTVCVNTVDVLVEKFAVPL